MWISENKELKKDIIDIINKNNNKIDTILNKIIKQQDEYEKMFEEHSKINVSENIIKNE